MALAGTSPFRPGSRKTANGTTAGDERETKMVGPERRGAVRVWREAGNSSRGGRDSCSGPDHDVLDATGRGGVSEQIGKLEKKKDDLMR